jgi:heme-degrading monooxygenase HmoA
MHACVVKTINAEQDALKKQADEYAAKLKTWDGFRSATLLIAANQSTSEYTFVALWDTEEHAKEGAIVLKAAGAVEVAVVGGSHWSSSVAGQLRGRVPSRCIMGP